MYQSSVHVMGMNVVCRSVTYFFIPVVGKISTKVLVSISTYICMSLCVCACVHACGDGVGVCMHAIFRASVSVFFLLDGFERYSEAREVGMTPVP